MTFGILNLETRAQKTTQERRRKILSAGLSDPTLVRHYMSWRVFSDELEVSLRVRDARFDPTTRRHKFKCPGVESQLRSVRPVVALEGTPASSPDTSDVPGSSTQLSLALQDVISLERQLRGLRSVRKGLP